VLHAGCSHANSIQILAVHSGVAARAGGEFGDDRADCGRILDQVSQALDELARNW